LNPQRSLNGDISLLDEATLKTLRLNLKVVKQQIKALKDELIARAEQARAALLPDDYRVLVMAMTHDDLAAQLDRYIITHRARIIVAVENWWDKYQMSLRTIEKEVKRSALHLEGHFGHIYQ